FSWVRSLRLLVPAVDTTVLPFRSFRVFRFDDFLDTQRLAGMKLVLVNETCCWRSMLFVVEPHSRSIVPLAISGMRLAEVTSWYFTSILGSFSSDFTASTMRAQ